MTTGRLEGQTLGGRSLAVRYANLVRLPHTVFALPFALLGVVYASWSYRVEAVELALVVVAFTAARFAAMGFNRVADRALDAKNPRTQNRELPAGRLTPLDAGVSVAVASGVFVLVAGLLNPLCLALSPLALGWILAYSYTKRFTSWSHLWLGGALAIAPVGGFLAIAGSWSTPWWTLVAIACSVAAWVAGFDIFYSLQDEEFDRRHQLHSAVVLLGEARSISLAKSLHLIALLGLVAFGVGGGFGVIYLAGVAVTGVLLAWEHRLVRPGDLSRLDAAFFQMNGIISIVMFVAALADRLI